MAQIASSNHEVPPPSYEEAISADLRDTSTIDSELPPNYEEATITESIAKLPSITNEEAREALLEESGTQCCWGSGTAKNLRLTELHSHPRFYLELRSMLEERTIKYKEEPYTGAPVDGPENGIRPGKWEIPTTKPAPTKFQEDKDEIPVPHTSTVHNCKKCGGAGRVTCQSCDGRGTKSESYTMTDSIGNMETNYRTVTCSQCRGKTRTECSTCKGYKKMERFQQLTVKWEVLSDDAFDQQTDVVEVPEKLLRKVSGNLLLEHKERQVAQLTNFPIDSINSLSQELLEKHKKPGKKTILQKLLVGAVPVTRCDYQWKKKVRNCIVYGKEQQVYAPKYPLRCCR